MNATQWHEKWKEGLAELDNISVRLERVKHNTDVYLQELDMQDAKAEAKQKRGFLRTLLRGAA